MPAPGSKYASLILSLILFLGAFQSHAEEVLVLYTWPDYINPELLERFHRDTGIKIQQAHYETDQTKEELLITTGGEGMDLIIGSAFSLRNHVKQGWLAPLSEPSLPNLRHIDRKWIDKWKSIATHTVPILWGSVGIVYRQDRISKPVRSWLDLYQPDPALKGHIMMIQDARDTVSLALKSLGYSANDQSLEALAQVEKLLLAQRPFVKTYSYPNLGADSELIRGDIWMAMIYNGDALALKELEPNLEFVVPQEGTAIWLDSIAIFESSKNKRNAHRFINFMLDPKNGAANSEYVNFATTNRSALKYLSNDHLQNPLIYPAAGVLSRSESLMPVETDYMRRINQLFASVLQLE